MVKHQQPYIFPLKGGSGSGDTVVIQVDEDITIDSLLVPKLTVEQIEQAYNALVAGKHCSIINSAGTSVYGVMQADSVTGHAAIIIPHYWMGYVDYQVTDHDTVDIVVHKVVTE